MTLYDFLKKQSAEGRIPFHMPGHMRGDHPYLVGSDIDFTEIDGLDDLHAPDGILADAMAYAADVFGAHRTFFLVGGSTVGVLAAVRAVAKGGKTVVAARNCHKSVYNALTLCGSDVKYITPAAHPLGFPLEITPESVGRALADTPDAAAVIVTSPTYEGVVSDLRSVADVCHALGVPLIVDAAHGAHLGFFDTDVPSAVQCGADITVNSLHKTMPSLTQTGLLHVTGDLIDEDKVAAALSVLETSSPSYILMASIDGCVHGYGNTAMFSAWRERVSRIRKAAEDTAVTLTVPDSFAFDESKLILSADGYSGSELAKILRTEHNIEPEMVARDYVLLMTGAGTTDAHTDALCRFFRSVKKRRKTEVDPVIAYRPCECVMKMETADAAESERIPLECAVGRVAAESVVPYPPGIPLIVPGERFDSTTVEQIRSVAESGGKIVLSGGRFAGEVRVVKQ